MFKPTAKKSIIAVILAAAALCTAAVLIAATMRGDPELVLRDRDSGKIYARYDLSEGERFSISFVHSVNQSPVTDTYEVRDRDFYVVETRYYGFGAGVQSELEEGQTLTYAQDGAMIISGFNTKMTGMIYVVGMVSDHLLELGGEQHSLTELCGRGSAVIFDLK